MKFIRGAKPKIILGIGLNSILSKVATVVLRGYDRDLVMKIKKLNNRTELDEEVINYNWKNTHKDKSYYDRLHHLFEFADDKKAEWSTNHGVHVAMGYSFYEHDGGNRISKEKEKRILVTIQEMRNEKIIKKRKGQH